jgi:hypothetical protein
LAFARKNAALLGGSVELVKSALGVGSTFRFTLRHPVLACSRNPARRQIIQNLPQYTYWPADLEATTSFFGAELEQLSCTKSLDRDSANFMIMSLGWISHDEQDLVKTLGPQQVAIGLTYLTKGGQKTETEASAGKIVYCQMPACRNRLVTAMDQAICWLQDQQQSTSLSRTPSRYNSETQAGKAHLDEVNGGL